jgi:hypothetical protein
MEQGALKPAVGSATDGIDRAACSIAPTASDPMTLIWESVNAAQAARQSRISNG